MSNNNELLRYAVCETCLGWMGVIGSPVGLKAVIFPLMSREALLKQIAITGCNLQNNGSASLNGLTDRLQRYLNGVIEDFYDKLDLAGTTDFQRSVWRVVRQIPRGETRNYGWIADQIGSPKAARAVGQALARNPVPIVIPCHRVISGDGRLGGFSGGLKLKKFLLDLEQRAQ
jgi:methylated-DNA-[protein]-cysteine S-methyltransferase